MTDTLISRDRLEFLLSLCYGVEHSSSSGRRGTEYDKGWRESRYSVYKKAGSIRDWLEKQTDVVVRLIADGVIMPYTKGNGDVAMLIDSSDLFGWGQSDAEEIEVKDIPNLLKALEESPNHGGILWVCRQYNMRPQKPYYEHFSDKEAALFDACGVSPESVTMED